MGGRTDKSLQGRIVGFGNGPEPPPLPEDYEVVWDEVENALGSLYESTMTGFDSVFEAFGIPSLTVEAKPQGKGKSMSSAGTDSTDVQTETLGAYRVVATSVIVSSTLELGGPCVTNLSSGDVIVVTKLARCNTRIRACIAEPVGWVSLVDAKTGQRWAEKTDEKVKTDEKAKADEKLVPREESSRKKTETKLTNDVPRINDEQTVHKPSQTKNLAEMEDLIDMALPSTAASQATVSGNAGGATQSLGLVMPPPKSACPLQVSAQLESEFGLSPAEASFATFEGLTSTPVALAPPIECFATFDSVPTTNVGQSTSSPLILGPATQTLSHHTPRGLALFDPVDSKANESNAKEKFLPVQRGLSIFDPLSDKSLDWADAFGN